MNKGAKVISQSIIGNDFRTIIVNKKGYTIYPPTIHSLSNAISYLCDVREGETLREILISLADLKYYAHALSWFINGDDSLFEELSKGTYEECVNGVEEAISMIDVSVFQKAVGLAKNVSLLAATPKQPVMKRYQDKLRRSWKICICLIKKLYMKYHIEIWF